MGALSPQPTRRCPSASRTLQKYTTFGKEATRREAGEGRLTIIILTKKTIGAAVAGGAHNTAGASSIVGAAIGDDSGVGGSGRPDVRRRTRALRRFRRASAAAAA